LKLARGGDLDTRVAANAAHRKRMRKETEPDFYDPTDLERAGELLDAERDSDLHHLTEMYEQTHRKE
jgi:hypothetical protein